MKIKILLALFAVANILAITNVHATATPASCQLYAVNQQEANNSQFFTVGFDLKVNDLKALYEGYDIQALAIHPKTNLIYAASGKNVAAGKPKGHLYQVDGKTAKLFSIGSTGFDDLGDLAFTPDGKLWAWAKDDGLIDIDPHTAISTLKMPVKVAIKSLATLKNKGKIFFAALQQQDSYDLLRYDMDTNDLKVVCNGVKGKAQDLEIFSEELFISGSDKGLHLLNSKKCTFDLEIPTGQFQKVKGIALPDNACQPNGTPIFQSFPKSGSTVDFGKVTLESSGLRTIAITETGNANLLLNSIIEGTHKDEFKLITPTSITIADGSTPKAITIKCTALDVGQREAILKIKSNDPSQAELTYKLICEGIEADSSKGGINEIPNELLLRAAQLLEDVRNDENSAPGWAKAQLSDDITPIYRPDLPELGRKPAYYNIPVEPSGFIIVSTGDHDFPIPHWNFIGQSPVQYLSEKAAKLGKKANRFYKLDALSYIAEDQENQQVADLGDFPRKAVGIQREWLNKEELSETTAVIPEPEKGAKVESDVRISGPQKFAFEFEKWESWQEYKEKSAETNRVLNEALRYDASKEWELISLTKEYGELLSAGESYQLAILPNKIPEIKLEGKGAQFVKVELLERRKQGLPPVIDIKVVDAPSDVEASFHLSLIYSSSDISKPIKLVIATKKQIVELPQINLELDSLKIPNVRGWSSWSTFWTGTHTDQRLYSQIPKKEFNNSSNCASGCGATSWAMLFGWGDYRASFNNSAWKHRWGLYRENGGYGNNVVAPKHMNQGIRNVSWEIRNYISTFCWDGQGATAPWNMSDAYKYLQGRTGATLRTHYNALGISTAGLRNRARDSIINRNVPAIIGTGWFKHYPLAYGYKWRRKKVKVLWWSYWKYERKFYVNQGWGGSGNGWIPARTWFVGQLYHN
jgi:hypothetical protein